MEDWERDLNKMFGKSQRSKEITGVHVHRFVKDLLKKERERDKLQELIDYVNESKSKTDILNNYVFDNMNYCERMEPSDELLGQLGMVMHDREVRILYILEKYFKKDSE